MPREKKTIPDDYRFGIGEWYGKSFVRLSPEERKHFADIQSLDRGERPQHLCLPRSTSSVEIQCTRDGGVCSLRRFHRSSDNAQVSVAPNRLGRLRTTCPYRFQQNGTIFSWIGEQILGHREPLIVSEIGLLAREPANILESEIECDTEDVGRIDSVLVSPNHSPMRWCALEVKALHFSGSSMSKEFKMLQTFTGNGIPFPVCARVSDYRRRGLMHLLSKLQTRVPSLRRWGKKMAVVVDQDLFAALGEMESVERLSDCDIAWFVVKYDESAGEAILTPDFMQLTTLERALEGLTVGKPVSLQRFESRIRDKLANSVTFA